MDMLTDQLNKTLTKETQIQKEETAELNPISFEEVLDEATRYFDGDELAAGVWLNKYALKDSEGNIYERTPDDMHRRIAKEIARIEKNYPRPLEEEEIYQALKGFKYIVPQGGPMTGVGNNFQVASLSNCFVVGNTGCGDSYGAILKTDQEQVQLMKRRGGVGHDLSEIRPKGTAVKNSALTSTGIVPFMERYSNSTREVAQDGRRGALMLSISIKHPEAENFIDAKLDSTKVTGANVSVRIDDDFMKAAMEGRSYKQQFPIDASAPNFTQEIDASELWKKIIHNAWKSAEPGILFWDTIIRESIPDCYADLGFKTVSTNPCGEIPLCPYDSCRLLALNLYSFVENPFTEEVRFDFVKFKKYARLSQRIMDDIIDLELEKIDLIIGKITKDPEDEAVKRVEKELWENIKKKCIEGRRTGIGITAEGDMLAALGMKYGSEESIKFSNRVHKTLALETYRSSVELAKDRGPFPIFDSAREVNNPFINRLKQADPSLYDDMKEYGRRNIALLTIAPTGTTSLMTQTSSGIEPVFMVSYKRRRKVNPNDQNVRVDFVDEVGDSWEEYNVFHHKFTDWLRINGYNVEEIKNMSDDELSEIIAQSPYHEATANHVDWVNKVKLQGSVQNWVDHSISVTVNVPADIDEEMVAKIYETGWRSGCKGMTIYRDGCRTGVLVTDTDDGTTDAIFEETSAPRRPQELDSQVVRFNNENESWIAVVGILEGRPYEIFTGKAEDSFYLPNWVKKGWVIKNKTEEGKSRYDFRYEDKDGYRVTIEGLSRSFNPEYWNYAKLISGVLRHGMPLPFVVHLVNNLHLMDDTLNTWKNGVARTLKSFIPDGTTPVESQCPSCGEEALVYEEGCLNCKSCGHSKCG